MRISKWLAVLAALLLLAGCGGGSSGGGKSSPPGFEIGAGDTITTAAEACVGCHDEVSGAGAVPVSVIHQNLTAVTPDTGNTPTINSVTITQQAEVTEVTVDIGTIAEVTDVTVRADTGGDLNDTYFDLYSAGDATAYYVWYNVAAGGTDPAPGGTGIEVAIGTGDAIDVVAAATAAAIDVVGDFGAVDDTVDTVTITNAALGAATDAANSTAATPTFTYAVTTQGENDDLDGTWFSLNSADDVDQYYVWFNVDAGGNDPDPGMTAIAVSIATGDTAASISSDTADAITAINGGLDFVADGVTVPGVVTITNVDDGLTTDAADSTPGTGFTIAVTTQGGDAVTVVVDVDDGAPVIGLSDSGIRFTFAQLVADATGGTSSWVSYINNASGVATYERANTSGTFVDNADGTYDYTFDNTYDLVGDTDTHRISLQVSSGIANDWTDFVPAAGGQTPVANPREIVLTDSCNECHAELGSTGTGGGLAMHGSSRRDVEYCVTCHNPGSYDTDTGNTVDFKVLIHKIHMGKNLPSVQNGGTYQIIGYGGSVHDYSKGAFPQPVTNCDKCHGNGATEGVNWYEFPTMEACGSCHDDTSWAASPPSGMIKHAYGSTSFPTGLAQTDNAGCAGCHPDDTSAPGTGFAIQNAHAWAQQVTLGQDYVYIIDSAVFDSGTDEVTVDYRVTDGGVDMDLDTGAWAVSGGASRLYLTVAWKPSGSADYTSPGAGSTSAPGAPLSFDLLCPVAASPCTPTTYSVTDNLDQTYTFVAELPNATGTGVVSIEGHPSESINGSEGGTQDLRLPVANAQMEFVISGSLETRRVVIDATKCENCHGGGVTGATVSMHGQNRTISAARDVTVCVICHNSANTDVDRRTTVAASNDGKAEQSINFKRMIHRIHRGRDSEAGFIEVWGYGGSQHIFAGEFPPGNRFENCDNCHVGGFSNEIPIAGGAHVEGTTIDSGADVSDHSDDLNISPNTATCSTCHDKPAALVHMQVMGGHLSVLEDDILFY